eukprot:107761-Chlamydomonas_euryale.AAC.2
MESGSDDEVCLSRKSSSSRACRPRSFRAATFLWRRATAARCRFAGLGDWPAGFAPANRWHGRQEGRLLINCVLAIQMAILAAPVVAMLWVVGAVAEGVSFASPV